MAMSVDPGGIAGPRQSADADGGFIGESAPVRQLRAYLRKLAQSSANVFIVGETGTGKERVAEFLHENSPRRSMPLVCVNCAAIPDALLESELFGYSRGAFTGAASAFAGQFRRAEGGTLFLDELGDMSPPAQAKILRVLESRRVQPLGSAQQVALDVRIVAATNTPPEKLLDAKRLRPDLYYRLNVARVNVPPLRERQRDVLLLFEFFAARLRPASARAMRLSADAAEYIVGYRWPGNVRELRNLVERILVDPPEGDITADYLRRALDFSAEPSAPAPESEEARILEALFQTQWNKRKAAEKLHWSRMTLYRKLAKYSISQRPG
jgi:DNA-binding NtrC family response regulator